MSDENKQIKSYSDFILCIKDFNPDENDRLPCVQVILHNVAGDSKEEICDKFKGVKKTTAFMRKLGFEKGIWAVISVLPMTDVIQIDYDKR